MQYFRSLIYLSIGAVALGLLLLQPSGFTVPVDAHCKLDDGQRVGHVYRFDASATPIAPQGAGSTELVPTPAAYQYYAMPVQAGPTPAADTPTPCVITLSGNSEYPRPASTPKPDGTDGEIFHLSYSGIPDLEYELAYSSNAGPGVSWDTYEATVTGGEWQPTPGFAFAGLKTLMDYWQGFAAALILVGVLALAWPW